MLQRFMLCIVAKIISILLCKVEALCEKNGELFDLPNLHSQHKSQSLSKKDIVICIAEQILPLLNFQFILWEFLQINMFSQHLQVVAEQYLLC